MSPTNFVTHRPPLVATMLAELGSKRLELLKVAVPRVVRVAVLWTPPPILSCERHGRRLQARANAQSLGGTQRGRPGPRVRSPREGTTGCPHDAFRWLTSGYRGLVGDFAKKHKLPTVFGAREFAEAGGLMSYAPDFAEGFRRAATYVDKILKGTKPADLPVEQPTRFELVINLKTAKALGLTIPQSLLVRVDQNISERRLMDC